MKYGVIYCFYDDEKVIKDVEVVKAKNIKTAFDITDRNLEMSVVIPVNRHNKVCLRG